MLEIKNTQVFGLEESIIASGYAMKTEPIDYTKEKDDKLNNHLKRATKLAKLGGGTGHSNFRTGIIVQFDIKYPQYWAMEAQRYHWFQIITSMSKMHKLLEFNIDECCNEYVTEETKHHLNKYIEHYKSLTKEDTQTDSSLIEKAWMTIISNCPMGLEMWMRVSTNYEQLATIYKQRKLHKLPEWKKFCNWIETLPLAKTLITCTDD